MSRIVDHDGKSKTSSAADHSHYPDPTETPVDEQTEPPSHAEIAALAHRLWVEQGRPTGSAEQNWFEAESELKTAAGSRTLVHKLHKHAGSVQS